MAGSARAAREATTPLHKRATPWNARKHGPQDFSQDVLPRSPETPVQASAYQRKIRERASPNNNEGPRAKRVKKKPEESETPLLRQLEQSGRHFWKESFHAQQQQKVKDKRSTGNHRLLPKNEVLTLALNEIAVTKSYGFFQYLPSRESLRSASDGTPVGRVPAAPGPRYPSIIYMSCHWNQSMRCAFLNSSHRARFLQSNAILNPPLLQTPLFAIQLIHTENIPLFATNPESIVIFSAAFAYFMATTEDVDNALGRKVSRSKAFRELRLEIPHIFKDSARGSEISNRDTGQRCESLESLYNAVTILCRSLSPTFTAKQLREEVIPRPSNLLSQRAGIPLGTPLPEEDDCMSNAPSRMCEKRKRRRKEEMEEASTANNDSDLTGQEAGKDVPGN